MAELSMGPTRTARSARPSFRDGLVAGLLAAAAVAAWYLVIDTVQGRPFFTPAALWSAFVSGVDQAEQVRITFGTVLGYTVIHVAVWCLIGVIVASILGALRTRPAALLGFALLVLVSVSLFIGLASSLAYWLVDVLGWWSIGVANISAMGVMVFYVAWRHAYIRDGLREDPMHEP